MFLGLLDEHRLPQCAAIQKLLEANIFRREAQLLGIHQLNLRLTAGRQHPVGISQVQAHRLFQHDMLAGGGGSDSHLAMEVVRSTDYDQIDFLHVQQAAIVSKMMGNAVLPGEGLGFAWAG